MSDLHVIIDGNNVFHALQIFQGNDTRPVEDYLQTLECKAAERGWQVTVVFDGPERYMPREQGLLTVEYAHPADTAIEKKVHDAAPGTPMVVVTRDRAEADVVMGYGARVWSPKDFERELNTPPLF